MEYYIISIDFIQFKKDLFLNLIPVSFLEDYYSQSEYLNTCTPDKIRVMLEEPIRDEVTTYLTRLREIDPSLVEF